MNQQIVWLGQDHPAPAQFSSKQGLCPFQSSQSAHNLGSYILGHLSVTKTPQHQIERKAIYATLHAPILVYKLLLTSLCLFAHHLIICPPHHISNYSLAF